MKACYLETAVPIDAPYGTIWFAKLHFDGQEIQLQDHRGKVEFSNSIEAQHMAAVEFNTNPTLREVEILIHQHHLNRWPSEIICIRDRDSLEAHYMRRVYRRFKTTGWNDDTMLRDALTELWRKHVQPSLC